MKKKPYWEMNTQELAAATREFDDPAFQPSAVAPTPAQRRALRAWKRKRVAARARLTLSLDKSLKEKAGQYATRQGMSLSALVSDALRQLIAKKSA